MSIELSVGWVLGIALGVVRAGALVSLCALVPRAIPRMARGILALALGLLIGEPIAHAATLSASDLVVDAFTNLVIGAVVGWFLGLAIQAFQVAGTIVDLGSGVTIGSVFDPDTGGSPGPFTRFYTLAAQTLIICAGGLFVVAQVLWASTRVVALDGRLNGFGLLGAVASSRVSAMFREGVQLALPVAAVLFVAELCFGLLSRLAPQINMFLIALPAKLLMSLSMMGTAAVLFPRVADHVLHEGVDTAMRLLGK